MMDSKMTARYVKELARDNQCNFYTLLKFGEDRPAIALDNKSVEILMNDLDDDYMVDCLDWGSNDYLLGD